MEKKMNLISLVLLAAMFVSCGSSKTTTLEQLNGTWQLSSFLGKDASKYFETDLPTLKINYAEKRISGNSGCNDYSGDFNYDNSTLKADKMVTTQKLCFRTNREGDYTRMLEEGVQISMSDYHLNWIRDGQTVASFVRLVDPIVFHGEWTLKTMNGQKVETLFEGVTGKPSLSFSLEKNLITGYGGCNQFSAPLKVTGNIIEVGLPAATRRACPGVENEASYIRSLKGVSVLKVVDGNLDIVREGKTVFTFERAKNDYRKAQE